MKFSLKVDVHPTERLSVTESDGDHVYSLLLSQSVVINYCLFSTLPGFLIANCECTWAKAFKFMLRNACTDQWRR